MTLERVEQHSEVGILKIAAPYWGRPRIGAWINAYLRQCQTLEDALWAMLETRTIDGGDEERLRVIGTLIGLPPFGLDIEVYRRVLRARALANRSRGTGVDIGRVLAAVFDDASNFSLQWSEGASLAATALLDVDSEYARGAAAALGAARGAGVSLQLLYGSDSDFVARYDRSVWGSVAPQSISFVGVTGATTGTGAVSIAWPGGHAAGDLGILALVHSNTLGMYAQPSGWDLQGVVNVTTNVALQVYTRRALSGAEAAATSASIGVERWVGTIAAYRGVGHVEAFATAASANVNSTTAVSAPALTSLGSGRRAVALWGAANGSADVSVYTPPIVTEVFDAAGGSGPGKRLAIADGIAGAGAFGPISATLATAQRSVAASLLLAPVDAARYLSVRQT